MVSLNDLTVRDGQQSLLATRMRTKDILEIVELLDKAGYYALEVWGGATFDSALRFLREDPWGRLKAIRETVRNTKLMMLLRAMNLVGYKHYPRDVVRKFIEYAYKDGIDIFRVFDALNDPNNLDYPIKIIKDLGAELQVCMVYSISPVHTMEYYIKLAEEFLHRFEPEYITIKDMSGILMPYVAEQLVKELKRLGVKVNVHSHTTAGMAPMTLLKSIEAGADLVDVTLSSLSLYTSHPPAESLIASLKNTPYDPHIDLEVLYKASELLWRIRQEYKDFDYALRNPPVDVRVLKHQIPGGMLSNLQAQLRELKAENKLPIVLEEVVRVREDLGWPPLVTPLSQIVGTQAVINVISGRYKVLIKEVRDYILGRYGKPPASIKQELIERVKSMESGVKLEKTITLDEARKRIPDYCVEKEEDYITYALFPEVAFEYLMEKCRRKRIIAYGLIEGIHDES